MTIYTRTGDQGETDLLRGGRVPKDAARLRVCGDLDELDAWLGVVRCEPLPEGVAALLEAIQRRMVDLRAQLVTVPPAQSTVAVTSQDVEILEQAVDRYDAKLEPLATFIVPGGSRAAATLHVARAVCRRAERELVSLARSEPEAVARPVLAYVNRLSDLLFVLARLANARAFIADTPC
jgi:cob(I)alamin adenosyltransferase